MAKNRIFKLYSVSKENINFFMTDVLSHRNQSIDVQSKSLDLFLYNRDLRHERVKLCQANILFLYLPKASVKHCFLIFSRGTKREHWPKMG